MLQDLCAAEDDVVSVELQVQALIWRQVCDGGLEGGGRGGRTYRGRGRGERGGGRVCKFFVLLKMMWFQWSFRSRCSLRDRSVMGAWEEGGWRNARAGTRHKQ